MSTGPADRASVLTSACLRASGASPRHSAPLPAATSARSSKRAGGLIPRVALDQCRVPERYRTRVPFRIPEREVDRAAPRFHFFIEIFESARYEPVEETGQGFDSLSAYMS